MYLILGYGQTGQSVERWCKRKNIVYKVYEDLPDLEGEKKAQALPWEDITFIIVSPGIDPQKSHTLFLARVRGIPCLTDVDLFCQEHSIARMIGITGTNGKSTTTALVTHILNENNIKAIAAGNIGQPVLDIINPSSYDFLVLELSSYQLELSSNIPLQIAVFLNLTEDHLERHHTMENYKQTKAKIFNACEFAILGDSDIYTRDVYQSLTIPKKQINIASYLNKFSSHSFLQGIHNIQNMAAAYEVGHFLGVEETKILDSIFSFRGLAHRFETVAQMGNILFINDSKATNAQATEKAFQNCGDRKIYWIAGGQPKQGGIENLSSYFSNIKKAYLIGEAALKFSQTLKNKVIHEISETLEKALEQVLQDISHEKEEAIVLLSPACASWDQFKNFEHRGQVFKSELTKLLNIKNNF